MKLLCFDMDNTLLNATRAHIEAYKKSLIKNNVKNINVKKMKHLFGIPSRIMLKRLYPNFNESQINNIVKDYHLIFINETRRFLKPYKGVKKLLKKLKEQYKLALVSNCTRLEIKKSFEAAKLPLSLFDVVVGCDQVKKSKPEPDEIFKAEKILHLKAEYMVGDTIYDIIAAKKAKTKAIIVLTSKQPKELLQRYKPYRIIKTLEELPNIL